MGEVNIFSAIGGNYMQTVLIIAIFVVMVALMYTKKLSAMFALPVMAFLIALVAGIPLMDRVLEDGTTEAGILNLMFVNGPQRLASSIFMVIYGAILSQIVRQSGIAETVIRKVSELAGDRPLVLGIAFFLHGGNHDSPYSGHSGCRRTAESCRKPCPEARRKENLTVD